MLVSGASVDTLDMIIYIKFEHRKEDIDVIILNIYVIQKKRKMKFDLSLYHCMYLKRNLKCTSKRGQSLGI